MKNFPGFPADDGGNSALTRLRAEVACNNHKDGNAPVSDSSLIHDDLRHILRLLDSPAMALGSIRTKNKAHASRENGKLGGRPKKKP